MSSNMQLLLKSQCTTATPLKVSIYFCTISKNYEHFDIIKTQIALLKKYK